MGEPQLLTDYLCSHYKICAVSAQGVNLSVQEFDGLVGADKRMIRRV